MPMTKAPRPALQGPNQPPGLVAPEDALPGSLRSGERLRELIRQAFDRARSSGRPDWQQMTVAVLKNRLLTLTGRAFKEADYGARTMSDLVRLLPDLVLLDESTPNPIVRLLPLSASEGPPELGPTSRVRRDLWNSVVDYRSGRTFVWDGQSARPAQVDDPELPNLPTQGPDEIDAWRRHFVDDHAADLGDDSEAQARARRWADERLPTATLPPLLRNQWNAELKRRVVETLLRWFSESRQKVPNDLIQSYRSLPVREQQGVPTDELRELVLRCVRAMTAEELRELRIPPAVYLRARH
jgi:hypothetical protein